MRVIVLYAFSIPHHDNQAGSIQSVLDLDTSIQFVKGVGPRVAEKLKEKNILVVEDLLYHLPFRYEDRLNPCALNELVPGEMASVIAEVRGTVLLRTKRMPIFEMTVGQGPTSMKCMWFHGTYLKDKFQPGQMLALYDKVEPSRSRAAVSKHVEWVCHGHPLRYPLPTNIAYDSYSRLRAAVREGGF